MSITPLEIAQQNFAKTMFGYDKAEVETFLELVSAEMTKMTKEVTKLSETNQDLSERLQDHKDRETGLKETMLAAQRVAEEMKINAQKEADIIIARAELSAEKLLEAAQRRHTLLLTDIGELKRRKIRMMTELKSNLVGFLEILNAQEDNNYFVGGIRPDSSGESEEETKTATHEVAEPAPAKSI